MAANMLTAYYIRGCDSKELFAPYKISQAESFEKHLNKYNVISFDMQKFLVKTKNVEDMLAEMEEEILEELLSEYPELEKYKRIDISKAAGKIFAYTDIPFVFIIDEWDCVLRYYNSESEQKKYL
ncbi:MAG: AAA family ATPase, partial [Oscillospiraceae bacterium]|nr:AAA family ATPase [Oscillospiraceae bacterium]